MIKTKEQLIDEYYEKEVEFLQYLAKRHAIREEELFPSPYDGFEMFEHDLSICLIENIRLKGKRWIKNHKTTDDMEVIKEKLWKWVSTTKVPSELYGEIRDDETYYILNCMLKDTYGVWFIDEEILKIQVKNAQRATCNVKKMLLQLAKYIHHVLKRGDVKWFESIDKTEESFIGMNLY